MGPREEALCTKAEKEYPLIGDYEWASGYAWVGIRHHDVVRWWVITMRRGLDAPEGLVCCREGICHRKVTTVENVEDALPLMACKLLMGVWE
jgi:hypothetical protein